MGETMIEILTFIDELKELKPVIVPLDNSKEDTDTKINKQIKKYERIVNDNQQDQS